MKKYVLVIISCVFYTLVFCQPSYYEFQRSISNARSNAAYIDAIETQARKPNSPLQQFSVDKNAINNMVNGWKQNGSGAPLYSAKELAQRERNAIYYDSLKIVEQAVKDANFKGYSTYYSIFKMYKPSLEEVEMSKLAKLCVDKYGRASDQSSYFFSMAYYVSIFDKMVTTASFTDLLKHILQYEIMPVTAINHLQQLEKRFPQYQEIIDLTILKVMPNYYDNFELRIEPSLPLSYYDSNENVLKMGNLYSTLIAKYPDKEEAFYALYNPNTNPYTASIEILLTQKKQKEAFELMEIFLKHPNKIIALYIRWQNRYAYIEQLEYTQVKELAKFHQANLLEIITDYTGELTYSVWKDYEIFHYSKPNEWQDLPYMTSSKALKIKLLAEDGDANAQNMYAIRVALGFEKNTKKIDAVEWFNKAIKSGNKFAQQNLDQICTLNLKGFKDYCKK